MEPINKYKCGNVCTNSKETFAQNIANMAVRALLTEVCATPKPGLVDRVNNGAHKDMDIFTFVDSAVTLYPYFKNITMHSLNYTGDIANLLKEIQLLGIQAEEDMFEVTRGINTHKGAVFSLGIFCAASAIIATRPHAYDDTASSISSLCAQIVANKTRTNTNLNTKGEGVFNTYGLKGILGEAQTGYASVFKTALPIINTYVKNGAHLQDASIVALLNLITILDDTNIVARHNIQTLRNIQTTVKEQLQTFTTVEQHITYAKALDEHFISKNISPGGCADLVALAILAHYIFS